MVGVNLRIVQPANAGKRAGQNATTVTKRDVIVPTLSEDERAAVAAEGGGLGLLGPTRRVCLVYVHEIGYCLPFPSLPFPSDQLITPSQFRNTHTQLQGPRLGLLVPALRHALLLGGLLQGGSAGLDRPTMIYDTQTRS